MFKAFTAGCASVLGFEIARRHGAGRLSWLIPIGVLAVGPASARYVGATAFAALHGAALRSPRRHIRSGLIPGIAWGCLSLFGLDMFVCGAIVVLAGPLITRLVDADRIPVMDPRIGWTLVGLAGVLGAAFASAAVTGTLGLALWDTIVCPLTYSPQHIAANVLDGLFRPQGMSIPFSQVFTGEQIGPAWSGHVRLREAAIQSISAIIIAVPLLALLLRRRLSDSRLGSLVALALSSWVVVLWRNDVAHVLAAFHSTLIVAVCLLGALREVRWSTVAIGVALLVAVMIPVGAERLWLLVNTSRPSLVHWDRDTAGILMERSRHVTIERILATMDAGLESPTAAWPAQPGLIFLSGRPLATRQVTLLAGSVRDESAVIADLRDRDPERLILGRVAGLAPGARSLDELTPTVWTHLRVNYLVELQLADGFEGFQVIRKAADSTVDLEDIPLGQRLPGTSQLVKNAQTPPLKPGVIVSQEFRVGGLDLRGVALLVAVTGPLPTEVDVQIGIEAAHSEEPARSLAVFRSRVPLDQHVQLRTLEFPAVAGSAGRLVVLNVSVVPGPEHEVRLLWHDQRQDKGSQVDYYQDGTASLNGTPVDADLFFVSY